MTLHEIVEATRHTGHGLRAELRTIEAACPGWHLWLSDAGCIYATHCYTAAERAAAMRAGQWETVTANAVTLPLSGVCVARQRIAEWEHHMLAAGAA